MHRHDPLVWQLLLLLFLILTSAFFSCAEIALISLNKNKLEKKSNSGNRQAKRILSLTSQPSKFLATIQVGNTLTGFLASAFAASNISGRLALWLVSAGVTIPARTLATVSMVIITVVLAFVQMVLGELVPKRLAMKKADVLAFPISGSILVISRIFAPSIRIRMTADLDRPDFSDRVLSLSRSWVSVRMRMETSLFMFSSDLSVSNEGIIICSMVITSFIMNRVGAERVGF